MRARVRARARLERRERTSWGSRVCPGYNVCLSVCRIDRAASLLSGVVQIRRMLKRGCAGELDSYAKYLDLMQRRGATIRIQHRGAEHNMELCSDDRSPLTDAVSEAA